MEIKYQHQDIIIIITIKIIEITNIIMCMIQREDSTIQIINGIDIMDGDLLKIKLLHRMIQILTFKGLITITMTLVSNQTTGLE